MILRRSTAAGSSVSGHPRTGLTGAARPIAAAVLIGSSALAGVAHAASYVPEALLVVSDFGSNPPRVRVMDPGRKTVVYDYAPAEQSLEGCNQANFFCAPLGMHYLNLGGEDYLDMALYVSNSNTGVPKPDAAYSVIQRIRPTSPPTQVWRMRGLDFTDVPDGDAYCTQDPADPCGPITDPRCEPQLVHEINVINDRPDLKQVTMVLADLNHGRVEQVTLDYSNGNSCGHVDWVLGPKHPEWPIGGLPNAIHYISDQPGGPYLINTYYQATGEVGGGGMVQMWQWDGQGWHSPWRFPEERDGAIALLNTPHMGEFLVDPATGQRWIGYSHSRGTAGAWDSYWDYGGSYGFLKPGATLADRPAYLLDAVVHADTRAETHFSRDIDFLDDGTLLLTDAGTESGTVEKYAARVFRLSPFLQGTQPSSKPGYYTPDQSQLNLVALPDPLVMGEYQCGFGSLFEADWVPAAKLGKTLKAAAQTTRTVCPKVR